MNSSERNRLWREKRWKEIEAMPKKQCSCGCGEWMHPINIQGKPIDYIKGHKQRGVKKHSNKTPLTAAERQRRQREKKYNLIASLPKIPCACGCGTMIAPIGRHMKPVQYVHGHNPNPPPKIVRQLPEYKNYPLKSGYSRAFTRGFRKLIRIRDNYTCQRCGKHQSELRRAIDVHHLDHNKMNNSPDNLVCACESCNAWASHHRDEPFINPDVWQRTHPN